MCGLDPDFDRVFFVGRTVEEVCFTANQITVVFDNDLRAILRDTHLFDAIVAETVAEARALFPMHTFDAVILDLHFERGEDGLTFGRYLQQQAIPTIACSGHPDLLNAPRTPAT